MATIGNINVSLSTSTAKFQAGLALARADLKSFGASMGSAIESAKGLGSALAGGLAAAGVGLGLKAVVGTAIEAEDAMARLAKVSDFDPDGLKEFKGQLQGLSTELKGVAIEDLYKIALESSKLGIASGDLLEYTKGIAKLSVAFDDVPADVLTSSIGKANVVFKLGARGALQLGSAIDKVGDSGVSSNGDILDVVQRISGVAAAARIGAPDAIALAGALLDTGAQAEAAGTALSKLLMKLTIPESQAAFAEAMGISADKFAAKVKAGPMKALLEFLAVLKNMDGAAQFAALQDILGKKNVQQVAEIQKLAAVVEKASTYAGEAAHQFATLDNINKSYAINAATTSAAITQVKNEFKILGDTIGSLFLPPLKVALSVLNSLVGGLADFLKVNEKIKAGVKSTVDKRTADYLATLKGQKSGAPKVDAKAEAKRALIAKQAANAAAEAGKDDDDDARELSKKELKDSAKSIGVAGTAILGDWNKQIERANDMMKEARTPLEKYKDDLAEINTLAKDRVLTEEQAAKLRTKLDKESNPFYEAGAAVGGIAADAASNAHAETHERKLAGAMELGSQEARSTVLDYRLSQGGKGKDGMQAVAKATDQTAKNTAGMAGILGKISSQLGGAANNFGTLAPIPIG